MGAAFFTDLGDRAADVTIMVSSEFGRWVAANQGGTDHGHGGVITIRSGRRLAGPLLGSWHGLNDLDSGDVPEYNTMFNVLRIGRPGPIRLTTAQIGKIFPRQEFTPMKLHA
ncbi:DUF1501 domain-containing protein [Micromonospora soli]|uniref:DUF1501 domain-containing protein n=1 Tax=Micromonospora sp. NBRC 110009 TaxID=3061627 RepID=UPI0026719A44|nr:DUF1501 domain-containing protein [Micromonospora sp. NBRC 110009]WKT96330.1 DUF1501 domain-containing protein [Micromonospora sp. NBRC 110009]